jgi:hypothetical protein
MMNQLERIAFHLLVTPIIAVLFLFNGSKPAPEAPVPDIFAPSHATTSQDHVAGPVITPKAVDTPHSNNNRQYFRPGPPLISTPIPVTGSTVGTEATLLTAEEWKQWPVLPDHISEEMRRLYQEGLRKGTDPHAFSIIGDCQSQPEFFLGIFDIEPLYVSILPVPLQQTVHQFSGSFARSSPTIRDGITAGAVLWNEWANSYQRGQVCRANENPLQCELRVHNPSIVFIHIGTHWEARNHRYLTLIVETIKQHGAVPVMVTKADNREGDERINLQSVQVAQEQGIPVWNFWASVQHTPNNGLEDNSEMYLNEHAVEIHRYSALQVLDMVWRAVK